jgi:hypothetical protein
MRTAPLLAVLLLVAPAGAQTPPEAGLHRAWLGELLDLDSAAAAALYGALGNDAHAPAGERLLAVARLLELQRIGAAEPEAVPGGVQLPPAAREALRGTQVARAACERLVTRAREQPGTLPGWLQEQPDRAMSRFNPRPLVPLVLAAALDATQAPDRDDRRRQLQVQFQQALRSGDRLQAVELRRQLRLLEAGRWDVRQLERSRALQVLRAELDGRADEAERLRHEWFQSWRPGAVSATPEVELRTALRNLEQLRSGGDLLAEEAEPLARLSQRLRAAAQRGDFAQALELLGRLPIYRERLLRDLERDR